MPVSRDRVLVVFPNGYYPQQSVIANGMPGTALAGENAVFEAEGWARTYGGSELQAGTHAATSMAYTASLTANSPIVDCGGGATLLTDFCPYQHIIIARVLYLIEEVQSDRYLKVSPTPSTTASGLAVARPPILMPIETQRGSSQGGRVVKYREEAFFGVGRGEFKLDGAGLSAALNLSDTPRVAYPLAAGGYDSRPVGFTKPATLPVVTSVAGGTKNMPAQAFSIKLTKKRLGFPGHGLASEAVEQTHGGAGNKFQVTLPAFDTSEGQTSWLIWATKAQTGQAQRGPWSLLGEYTTVTPSTVDIEWRDDELGDRLVDNNDTPPPSLYVASLDDLLIFASCLGAPDVSGNPTAPGPGFAVAKPNNPEAFPAQAYAFTTPAENVRGVLTGSSRLYALTANHLHIGTLTGSSATPLVFRPYWQSGFRHQHNAVMAGDVLYGLTGDLLMRTVSGEDADASFSAPIKPELEQVIVERAFVGHDPRNGWVVIFHANATQSGGYWRTTALSFNYKTGKWNTPITLSSPSADITVCGVATVGQELYYILTNGEVYLWDWGAGTVAGYIATAFQDAGSYLTLKTARAVGLVGKFNGTLTFHRDYAISDVQSGGNAAASIAVNNPSYVSQHFSIWKCNVRGRSLALRLGFSMPGRTQIFDGAEVALEIRQGSLR